jgi:hypothetical protein
VSIQALDDPTVRATAEARFFAPAQ